MFATERTPPNQPPLGARPEAPPSTPSRQQPPREAKTAANATFTQTPRSASSSPPRRKNLADDFRKAKKAPAGTAPAGQHAAAGGAPTAKPPKPSKAPAGGNPNPVGGSQGSAPSNPDPATAGGDPKANPTQQRAKEEAAVKIRVAKTKITRRNWLGRSESWTDQLELCHHRPVHTRSGPPPNSPLYLED